MLCSNKFLLTTVPLLLSATLLGAPALAADNGNVKAPPSAQTTPQAQTQFQARNTAGSGQTQTGPLGDHKAEAQQLIDEATAEVRTMKADPKLRQLMAKAQGIYLVPEFGRGALVIGGRGGAGVVLAKHNGTWSDPAFYDFGAISFGLQAGGSGGQVAFLLMTKNAVDAFMSGNKVSLNAGARLTIVDFSHNGQASWGKGDIVMWSNTAGAYAGATISVTDVNWADNNNRAYYGRQVQPNQVLAGEVPSPQASELKDALSG